MKMWASEARFGDAEGLAWLARRGGKLVGWSAIMDGEMSIYVKASERRTGVGSQLVRAMGYLGAIRAKPHDREGERFFIRHGISF